MNQYSGIESKFQQLASSMRIVIQILDDIESEVTQLQQGTSPSDADPNGSSAPRDARSGNPTPAGGPWGYPSGPYSPLPPMAQWMWPPFGGGYPWMGWPVLPVQPWAGNWMWGGPPEATPAAAKVPHPSRWSWSWDTTRPPYAAESTAPDPRTTR